MSPRATPTHSVLGAAACAVLVLGCGGAAPLMHAAHVMPPGKVSAAAGAAGQLTVLDRAEPARDDTSGPVVEDFTVAPGLTPYAAGRVGIEGDNEAGLSWSGRAFRLDARHAFDVGPLQLSLGLGGSALAPRSRGGDDDLGSASGGGGDVPILLGWKSDAELYSVWFGPRVGFELLSGSVIESEISPSGRVDTFVPFSATHVFAGGVIGAKVGFRMIHVALEMNVLYHYGDGTLGERDERAAEIEQLTIAPASAIILTL